MMIVLVRSQLRNEATNLGAVIRPMQAMPHHTVDPKQVEQLHSSATGGPIPSAADRSWCLLVPTKLCPSLNARDDHANF
jgi:hypothetical protein